MGAVDTPQPRSGGGKKGKGFHRPKRRVGVRIDMTPMVDVAFLLLVFFMVTTVFRRPLAMEVNLPEVGAKIEVPESNVLTIFVRGDDTMTYRMGPGTMAPLTWAQLLPTLEAAMKANKELIVLVKIDAKEQPPVAATLDDVVAKAQALGASRTVPVVISGHRERPYGEIVDLLDRLQRQDIHAALMVKPGK